MRTRKQIELASASDYPDHLLLEVLLDIRDALTANEQNVNIKLNRNMETNLPPKFPKKGEA